MNKSEYVTPDFIAMERALMDQWNLLLRDGASSKKVVDCSIAMAQLAQAICKAYDYRREHPNACISFNPDNCLSFEE